jgi:hypothetical protein
MVGTMTKRDIYILQANHLDEDSRDYQPVNLCAFFSKDDAEFAKLEAEEDRKAKQKEREAAYKARDEYNRGHVVHMKLWWSTRVINEENRDMAIRESRGYMDDRVCPEIPHDDLPESFQIDEVELDDGT